MCIKCTKDNRDYKSCKTCTMKLARSQNRPKFLNFSNSSSPAAEPFDTSIPRSGGKRIFSESPVGLLQPEPSQRSHHRCWDQNAHVDSAVFGGHVAPSFLFSGTDRFYRLPARRKNTVSAPPAWRRGAVSLNAFEADNIVFAYLVRSPAARLERYGATVWKPQVVCATIQSSYIRYAGVT